jgi:hypothetical protein
MNRFRFSLKWLLAAIAFIALGCAALANASAFWEMVIVSLGWCLILTAVLAGIFRRGSSQAFAIGFVVVLVAYLLIDARFEYRDRGNRIATTAVLRHLHSAVIREVPYEPQPTIMVIRPQWGYFRPIGQWLWSIVFGFVGGLLARHFHTRRERDRLLSSAAA